MWHAETTAKIDIVLPHGDGTIKKGTRITITRGRNQPFALWYHGWIYDLPKRYVFSSKIKVPKKGTA
jgi:hypothetical protein